MEEFKNSQNNEGMSPSSQSPDSPQEGSEKRIKKTPRRQGFSLLQKINRGRRYMRYHWFKLISIKGAALSLALPMAFGISIAFIPTFGLGAPLTFFFAMLFKVSKTAGVLASVAITPFVPFLYAMDLLVAGFIGRGKIEVEDLTTQASEALEAVTQQNMFHPSSILSASSNILIASLILCVFSFIILFPTFYFAISSYQKKRLHIKKEKIKKGFTKREKASRCRLLRHNKAVNSGGYLRIADIKKKPRQNPLLKIHKKKRQ